MGAHCWSHHRKKEVIPARTGKGYQLSKYLRRLPDFKYQTAYTRLACSYAHLGCEKPLRGGLLLVSRFSSPSPH